MSFRRAIGIGDKGAVIRETFDIAEAGQPALESLEVRFK